MYLFVADWHLDKGGPGGIVQPAALSIKEYGVGQSASPAPGVGGGGTMFYGTAGV